MTIKAPYWLRYSAVVLAGCVFFGLLWWLFYQGRIGVDFGFLPVFFTSALLTFALIIACLMVFLPHWWKALTKEQRWFGGVLLGGLFFCISLSLSHVKIEINAETTDPYGTYAKVVLSVVVIIASVMVFLAQATPRVFEKRGVSLLYPVMLLLLAVFISIPTCLVHRLFPSSVYFLVVGAIFFLWSLLVIIDEETLGATLSERATYESRKKEGVIIPEESRITGKVFPYEIKVYKGDAILALCDSIEEGREFARKVILAGNHGIYITADRPWTMIKQEFGKDYLKDEAKNLYCIDCFTNFYGLNEFKDAEMPDKARNFYSYTPRPVTIRELHRALRDIRRRVVSKLLCQQLWSTILSCERDVWSQLKGRMRGKKKDVEKELADGGKERKENVQIIYDSVSAFASIFNLEDLLRFLIHDTNIDRAIGRNTVLLVKEGVFDKDIIARLASFCEIFVKPKIENGHVYIHIYKIKDKKLPEDSPWIVKAVP